MTELLFLGSAMRLWYDFKTCWPFGLPCQVSFQTANALAVRTRTRCTLYYASVADEGAIGVRLNRLDQAAYLLTVLL